MSTSRERSMRNSVIAHARTIARLALTLAIACLAASADAANGTWSATANNTWSVTGAWVSGTIPGSTSSTTNTDIAFFTSSASGRTITVDANRNIGSITLGFTGAVGTSLSGGNLLLTSGGTIQTISTGTQVHSVNTAMAIQGDGGSYTFAINGASGSSSLSSNGAISGVSTSGSTTTLTLTGVNVSGTGTLTGIISDGTFGGKLAIVKGGTSTWRLGGANTFTGGLTLNSGTLILANARALGNTGTLTINGGVLDTVAVVALTSTTPMVLNADLNYAGSAGSLDLNSVSTTLSQNRSIIVTSNTLTLGGTISGGFGITKAGGGMLQLKGTNTYTGDTTINSGTLSLGAVSSTAGSLSPSSAITGSAGATLLFARSNTITQGTDFGAIGGSINVTKAGATGATAVLTNANTYTGTTTVSAGILQIGNDGSTGSLSTSSVITGAAGATLRFQRSDTITQGTDFNSVIGGAMNVEQSGSGALVLNGVNTYTGTTTLSKGELRISSDANISGTASPLAFNSGTLTILGTTLTALNTSRPTTFVSGSTVNFNINDASNVFTVSQVLNQAAGGLVKTGSGTLLITNTNTYTGVTTVSQGTLRLAGGAAIADTGTVSMQGGTLRLDDSETINSLNFANANGGSVTAPSGATLTFSGLISATNNATPLVISANLTGSGAISMNDGAKLTLTGSNSYTGNTVVAPSSAGVTSTLLVVGNDYALGSSGTIIQGGIATTGYKTLTLRSSVDGVSLVVPMQVSKFTYLIFDGTNSLTLGGTVAGAQDVNITNNQPSDKLLTFRSLQAFSGTSNSNATWNFSGSGNTSLGNFFHGAAAAVNVFMSSTGTTTLTGTMDILTAVRVDNGRFVVGANALLQSTGTTVFVPTISGSTAGTFEYASNQNSTLAGVMSGNVNLAKTAAGRLTLQAANTFTGSAAISAGVLEVVAAGRMNGTSGVTLDGSGAEFKYNSSTAYTQPLTVTQGTVSGTGTISASGGVTIGTSAVISPGNSPGIQAYTTGLTWASGGSYTWEINDWTGGAGTAYDQVRVTGAPLNITATSGSTFTINITSLSGTSAGAVANWSNVSKTFTIATATSGGGVTNFSANTFSLNSTQFVAQNPTAAGSWSISATGSTVLLNYTVQSTTNGSYSLSASAGAASIIVGGTSTITATLTNTGTGTADALNFNTLAVSNGVSISPATGSNLAQGASGTGTGAFTPGSSGTYTLTPTATVTNVTASGSPVQTSTTSATVNVYDHASGSAAGTTIALGDSIVGFSGTLNGLTSATISNAAGYRVDLKTTGTTTLGAVSINNVTGVAAGGSQTVSAAASLDGSQSVGANALGQTFTLTYADDSALAGASSSLGSQQVTVTGNVLAHSEASLAGGLTPVISDTISLGVWDWDKGLWTSGSGSLAFSLFNLASTSPASLTAALDVTGTNGSGDSGFTTTFNLASYSLIAGGSSANYFASFTPSGTTSGTYTATFTFSTADQNLPGKSAGSTLTLTTSVVVVPEPATIVLAGLGVGLAGLGVWSRRRRAA